MRRVARFWLASVVLGAGLAMSASPALAAEGPPKARPGVQQAETPFPGLDPFTHSPDFFPILTWDKLRGWKPPYRDAQQGLASIAECRFTIAGFVNVEDRADYAMIVNLSLSRSANIQLETIKTCKTKQVVSAETGRPSPLYETSGLWLPAGHGALIRFE